MNKAKAESSLVKKKWSKPALFDAKIDKTDHVQSSGGDNLTMGS